MGLQPAAQRPHVGRGDICKVCIEHKNIVVVEAISYATY